MFTLCWTPEAKAAFEDLRDKAKASLASRPEEGEGEVLKRRRTVQTGA